MKEPVAGPEGGEKGVVLFDVVGGDVYIASVSTSAPVLLKGGVSKVTAFSNKGLGWKFGSVANRAVMHPHGGLEGATYLDMYSDTPLFSWRAVPLNSFPDDYAASLASVITSELPFFAGSGFRYYPLTARGGEEKASFWSFRRLLKEKVGTNRE